MDYGEGFYKLMKRKEDKINSLNISDERKLKLFFSVTRDLQKYEQIKINLKIYQELEKIASLIAISLSNIEKISKNKNILPFPDYIPFSNN